MRASRIALVLLFAAPGCFDFEADLTRCRELGKCVDFPDAAVEPDGGEDAGEDAGATVDAGVTDAGLPPSAGSCLNAEFCWEHPLPFANELSGVHAFSEDEAYAVGPGGTIVRFDGQRWVGEFVPGAQQQNFDLADVWGADPSDVWAVGHDGLLLRRRGGAWGVASFGGLLVAGYTNALGGSGVADVWAAGQYGKVLRFDGGSWAVANGGLGVFGDPGNGIDPHALEVTPGGDVWLAGDPVLAAVGRGGSFQRFDGGSGTLRGVAVLPDGGAVFCASEDTLYELQGGTLVTVNPNLTVRCQGMVASGERLTLVGDNAAGHLAFSQCTSDGVCGVNGTIERGAYFSDVSSTDAGALFMAGAFGSLLRISASAAEETFFSSGDLTDVTAIWASSETEAWALGTGVVLKLDGGGWEEQRGNEIFPEALPWRGVTGGRAGEVVAASEVGIVYSSRPPIYYEADAGFRGIWGDPSGVLFVVGASPSGAGVVHKREADAGWQALVLPPFTDGGVVPALNAVWGSGPSDVYVAGEGGALLRYDGSGFSDLSAGADELRAIHGAGGDVYAVGDDLTILHKAAGANGFTKVTPSVTLATRYAGRRISGLHVEAPTRLTLVGGNGLVLTLEGTLWDDPHPSTGLDLYAVTAAGRARWVTGQAGAILRRR